jgi:hypothetical protein
MFNINEFKSHINSNGYVPTNKYYVEFGSPPLMQRSTININGNQVRLSDVGQLLQFRAESVRAPGIVVSTSNNQRYGFGPTQQVPTNVNFTNISASFLADARGLVWGYFYQWFNTIFGFDEVISTSGISSNYNTFRVNYKVDYVADITIKIYDHAGKMTTSLTLRDAFPISMNDISLAWDSTNQLKRITVSFSYRSWKMNGTDTNADSLSDTHITPKILNIPKYSALPTTNGYNYNTR